MMLDCDERELDRDEARAEDAAERAFSRRVCLECGSMGGHVAGCPEAPEAPDDPYEMTSEELRDYLDGMSRGELIVYAMETTESAANEQYTADNLRALLRVEYQLRAGEGNPFPCVARQCANYGKTPTRNACRCRTDAQAAHERRVLSALVSP